MDKKNYTTYEGRCRKCNEYGHHSLITELCENCMEKTKKKIAKIIEEKKAYNFMKKNSKLISTKKMRSE
jgi:hypothetical protein